MMKYRLRLNSSQYLIGSYDELKHLLQLAAGQPFAELELTQIQEPERAPGLITRLLAPIMKWDVNLLNVEDEIWALMCGDVAVMSYTEKTGCTFYSVGSDNIRLGATMMDFYLGTGEQVKYPKEQCISSEEVIRVVLRFYEMGSRPQCIRWVTFDDIVE